MPSIKEVAALAGVSTSTVSRVISGKNPVEQKTRERVEEAIRKLGYRPNLVAAGLRSKSGKSVGLLVPKIADPFFAELINHVDRYVVDRGYNLLLFNTHSDPEFEKRVVDNLLRRHVDGIIFSLVSDESLAMELLADVGVPVVMLDRVRESAPLMSLVLDNRRAGSLTAEHLLGLGHARVACLAGPEHIRLCGERLEGFRDRLASGGVELPQERILRGDWSFESGLDAAERLCAFRPAVTAIWAQNDMMAAGVLKGLLRRGIVVPGQVSLVGMDDAGVPATLHPSLTTIAQPIQEMAERAVDMILRAKARVGVHSRVVLKPRLVVRESTGRCPGA